MLVCVCVLNLCVLSVGVTVRLLSRLACGCGLWLLMPLVACGLWFMVCGLWLVACGLWLVTCDLWLVPVAYAVACGLLLWLVTCSLSLVA